MIYAVIALGLIALLLIGLWISRQNTIDHLSDKLIDANAQIASLKAKNELLENDDSRFKAVASQIMADNSREFKRQNEERLAEILKPFNDNLATFYKTVAEAYATESRERFSLSREIKELVELNQKVGMQAHDLTMVLKGNTHSAGGWGEMVLERILENSGLRKNEEYVIQDSTKIDDGTKLRPDAVVKYPDGRCVVIDSKVSLSAFLELQNITDADARQKICERHATQVQRHITELRGKQYHEYIGTEKLDFVMMFIPNEPAYLTAMNTKPELWQIAYDAHVLIVSPTHLISALKLIEQLWRHDRQSQYAVKIAEEGGKLYDKLKGFLDDMDTIKKSLDAAQVTYQKAMGKLSTGNGNVLRRAENMRQMGIKAAKEIASKGDEEERTRR